MQRLLNPIYCRRSDCRIRGCIYFSKTINAGEAVGKPRVASATPEINRPWRNMENLTRLPWVDGLWKL